MLLAPVLLLVVGFQSPVDLTKRITYETVAVPASRAVAEMAKLTGMKLAADTEMGRDIVVVRFLDIPLKDALPKLANAVAGKWKQQAGSYVLVPDIGLRQKQARDELAQRASRIAKEIKAKIDAKTAASAPPDVKAALAEDTNVVDNKLIAKLLTQLDPMSIASMGKEDRVVYSSNPTAMQVQLPAVDRDALAALIKAHNEGVKALKSASAEADASPESQQAKEFAKTMGMDFEQHEITEMPAKILLTLENGSIMGGTTLNLRFYDRNGRVSYQESDRLEGGGGGLMAMAMDITEQQKPKKDDQPKEPKGTLIKYSAVTQEILNLFSGRNFMSGQLPKLSSDAQAKLLRPNDFDPLSFVTSEALLAVAKERNEQLVADLADNSSDLIAATIATKETTGDFMTRLKREKSTVSVLESGGWLEVFPVEPDNARVHRMDREALGSFVRAAHEKGMLRLDDLAQYALRAERPEFGGPSIIYLGLYAPTLIAGSFTGSNDWNMLRFYGLLSSPQKESMANGTALRLNQLSQDQVEVFREMTYGGSPKLNVARNGEVKPQSKGYFFDMVSNFAPQLHRDYLEEPTEALPNGLPSGAEIHVDVTDHHIVKPASKEATMLSMMGAMGAEEYGMMKMFTDDPKTAGMVNMPKLDKFQVGTRRTLDFTFLLSSNLSLRKKLNDDQLEKDAPAVAADGLPAAFKAEVDKVVAEMKKMPFPMNFGMAAPVKPPL